MEEKDKQEDTQSSQEATPEASQSSSGDQKQVAEGDQHRTLAIVGYILPILFFLPLLN